MASSGPYINVHEIFLKYEPELRKRFDTIIDEFEMGNEELTLNLLKALTVDEHNLFSQYKQDLRKIRAVQDALAAEIAQNDREIEELNKQISENRSKHAAVLNNFKKEHFKASNIHPAEHNNNPSFTTRVKRFFNI